MATEKIYSLNGWANLCHDGFTMSFTSGENDLQKNVTKNKKIIIHLGSGFGPTRKLEKGETSFTGFVLIDNASECVYECESDNGFSLRKIYGLINDSYFKYCDEYHGSDYDYVSNMSLTGFKLVDNVHVYPSYDT